MINRRLIFTFAFALITTLSMNAQDDDLYFTPSKKKVNSELISSVSHPRNVTIVNAQPPVLAVYSNNKRSEDEYNRRYKSMTEWQTSGGVEDSLAASVEYLDSLEGYDINDPELDYSYSRRILRFHSPSFGYYLTSPYYWDLAYGYGAFDDFYYPYYYDPFYWNYGWGYGYVSGPWDCWYGPLWGWRHPTYWSTWGYTPGWHHHNYVSADPRRYSYRTNNAIRNSYMPVQQGRVASIRSNALLNANSNRRMYNNQLASLNKGVPSLQNRAIASNGTQRTRTAESYNRPSSTRQSVRSNDALRSTNNVNRTPSRTVERSSTPVRSSNSYSAPTRSYSAPSGGGMGGGSRGGMSGGGRVGRH